jgi:ATP synthase protein I
MMAAADHHDRSPEVTPDVPESDAPESERKRWQDASAVPTVDPWHVVSYLISGVTIWGFIGWAAARWLDIPALIGVGFIIGGVLGIWLTYIRYGRPQSGSSSSMPPAQPDLPVPDLPGASASVRSRSAQRPSGPPSSDTTAEEGKP